MSDRINLKVTKDQLNVLAKICIEIDRNYKLSRDGSVDAVFSSVKLRLYNQTLATIFVENGLTFDE